MPAIPQAVLDGMTPLEREWFQFFVEAIKVDYGITKASDYIALYMAALDYVILWRVQAVQLATGELMTAARHHPGAHLRAWLDSMSTTRKARKEAPASAEDEQLESWKQGLRKISS